MSLTNQPFVSVVILLGAQRNRAERALASLLNQEHLDQAEILLLDTAYDKYPPILGSEHPAVKTIDSTNAVSYGALRAHGVQMASGEVVAYLEDHSQALPGWLNSVIRGFRAGYAGVGGMPQTSNPRIGFSDLTEMMVYKYPASDSSSRAYVTDTLPNQNSAYRRDILLSFGNLLPSLMSSDFLLGIKITEKGHKLLIDPECRYLHANLENTMMVRGNLFYWNIIFGRLRAEVFHWSWLRRILQVSVTPISPFVRYFKYLYHLYRYDQKKLPLLLRYTGMMLYIQNVAAIGVAIGCLFDIKNAQLKYLRSELDWDHHANQSHQGLI